MSLIVSCATVEIQRQSKPYEEHGIIIRVIDIDQEYLSYLYEYNLAKLYYEVINNSNKEYSSYRVLIEVTCKDESRFTTWTSGSTVPAGMRITDYTYVDTAGRMVISSEVKTIRVLE